MNSPETHKWRTLILVVLTDMTVVAIPTMGLSVLSKQISDDLGLTVVQVGIVWGVAALPGILSSILGGAIGDRFGPRRIMILGALVAGLMGAARGLSPNFITLAVAAALMGAVVPFVIMSGLKTIGQTFPSKQLGLANGLNSMGMALGFFIGSMFSATVFSPLLGGWRPVLIGYGILAAGMGVPWLFMPRSLETPRETRTGINATVKPRQSLGRNIAHVARLGNVWILGFTLFGFSGAIQGVLGYLPLHLRTIGWQATLADGSVAAFHLVSLIFVLPLALWSDRLSSRKRLLMFIATAAASGIALLSVVSGGVVWAAVLLTGFVRDAFMAIILTMVIETRGVGAAYAGTATGLVMAVAGIANVAAPPLGNSLVTRSTGAPFAFWAGLVALGIVCLATYDRRRRSPRNEQGSR